MKKIVSVLVLLPLLASCGEPSSLVSSMATSSNSMSTSFSNSSILNPSISETSSSSNPSSSSILISSEEIDPNYHMLADGLYVNYLPGVYDENITLDFKITKPNRKLYYTFDYDLKDPYALDEYTKPLSIKPITSYDLDDYPLTTSVDAILANDTGGKCVSVNYINNIQNTGEYILAPKQNVLGIVYADMNTKEILLSKTLTYIIDRKGIDAYKIPIVSLSLPYEDMFGANGFYNKIREEIETRVNLEYIDPTTGEYFYRNSQIKLGGNWSLGYPQRTLNLNFNKDENGNKNEPVTEHIFKDRKKCGNQNESLDEFTRFRLHNGGNCFEERTGFNDALIQNMMAGTHIATTAYRPCITYINGEYWGNYSIREHYKDTFFATNYGVKKKDVILYELKGIFLLDDGDAVAGESCYNNLVNYIASNDFSLDSVYEEFISDYVDIDSFIDMFIAQSYAGNWDFVGNSNNLKMWRTSSVDKSNPYADGRWRFAMHDCDFAFTDYELFLRKDHVNSYSKFPMFASLLKNKKFKERFLNRAIELLETNLSATNASKILNKMFVEIKPYKMRSAYRWGQKSSFESYWMSELSNTQTFFKNRDENYLLELNKVLDTYE